MPEQKIIDTKAQLNKDNTQFELIVAYSDINIEPPPPPGPIIPRCLPANIIPSSGVYFGTVLISLETEQEQGVIYYTLDGTNPTPEDFLYTTPFNILANTVVKTRVFSEIATPSVIFTNTYEILPYEVIFEPESGNYTGAIPVSLFPNFLGGQIRFTIDGSTPTIESPLYTTQLNINQIRTVKAIAGSGEFFGPVFEQTYNIKALSPEFDTTPGVYLTSKTVVITNPNTANGFSGTIYYTLDGSTPTTSSLVYSDPLEITESTVIKAIVGAIGQFINSDVAEINVQIQCAAPTISPDGGVFEDSQEVTITTNEPDGVTYYTTDGSEPTESSTLYSVPFTITATTDVKAKTFRSGTTPSETVTTPFTKAFVPALAGAFNDRLYFSDNNFGSWSEIRPLGNLNRGWFDARIGDFGQFSQVYAVEGFRYSDDAMQSWKTPSFPSPLVGNPFRVTATKSAQKVAITANIGNGRFQVLVSLDGGANFVDRSPNLSSFTEIAYTPDGTGLYCSKQGNASNTEVLYYSNNDGLTWTATYSENTRKIENLIATDNAIYFMIFNSTTDAFVGFHRSTDNGATRSLINGAGSNYRRGWVSGNDSLIVLASILSTNILRISLDQGVTWANFTIPTTTTTIRVTSSYDATRWIIGTSTRLYVSLNSMGSVSETQPAGNVNRGWQLATTTS